MPKKQHPQTLGQPVPKLNLSDLDGKAHDLSAALTGKRGAVVVFWSSVCSHCVRYDNYLNNFQDRHPGLTLFIVASRQNEDADRLRAAVIGRRLRFPILRDPERKVAHAWLVEQTPRVFLVDAACKLRYRGAIDNFKYPGDPEHAPYLEDAVKALLGGQAIGRSETPSFGCPIESVYYDMPKPLYD